MPAQILRMSFMNSNNDKFRSDYYNDNFSGEAGPDTLRQAHTANVTAPERPQDISAYDRSPYQEPPKRKKKKRILLKIFFAIIGLIFAFVVAFLGVAWIKTLSIPVKTNFLIMATDEAGTRTDTLMLGTFDKKTKAISLISIPRDTYVTVDDDTYNLMREEYPQPAGKSMKINTVHHFAGADHGVDMLCKEVGHLLDTEIDFYVKVDFDAFRYIIDSVGGIEFDVPQDMHYSDPYQDLYIDLKAGLQLLDGEKAEHLLRYRSGYATADIGRIEVQQNFMKAFIAQTLSKGTILSNPGVYLDAVFKYDFVKTNAAASDIVSYALLAGGIDIGNVHTMTLPGGPAMRGGQSVYLPDISKIDNEVAKIVGD